MVVAKSAVHLSVNRESMVYLIYCNCYRGVYSECVSSALYDVDTNKNKVTQYLLQLICDWMFRYTAI